MFRAAVVSLALLATAAHAEGTVGELERQCAPMLGPRDSLTREQKLDAMDCMNYLKGVWDGLTLAGAETGRRLFCPPASGVAAMDMARIFLAMSVAAPPAVRNAPSSAPAVFLLGLQKRYPC